METLALTSELRKRFNIRVGGLFIIGALVVLMDEVTREGYVLDPADLLNPQITHEKIFVILLILGLIFGRRRREKAGTDKIDDRSMTFYPKPSPLMLKELARRWGALSEDVKVFLPIMYVTEGIGSFFALFGFLFRDLFQLLMGVIFIVISMAYHVITYVAMMHDEDMRREVREGKGW